MSCGVGCRPASDPVLLWLWCRPAATAPIQPLAWEPPYAAGAAQEMEKIKNKKKLLLMLYLQVSLRIPGIPFSHILQKARNVQSLRQ